jgi:peptidoglycan/xylan/chitin deacetylase (PgdA/CDA1 family)
MLIVTLMLLWLGLTGTISLYWFIIPLVVLMVCHTLGSIILSWQYFVRVKSKADTSSNAIALTFDDGPVSGKTEKILSILQQHRVKASFFCIGHRVRENQALARRVHEEGHLLGNHSYWHKATFDLQTGGAITRELADTDNVLHDVVGQYPTFFRPPYGVTNPMVATAVRRGKYAVIGWSIRSFDTVTKDPDKLLSTVTRSIRGGDIILFHDYCDSTIAILPALLEHVAKLGLKVVRVDELLNEKAYR